MVKKKKKSMKKKGDMACDMKGGCGGFGYFLGIIGAAVYYISTSIGFWNGFLGLLKALVWPAFLVFEVLKYMAV